MPRNTAVDWTLRHALALRILCGLLIIAVGVLSAVPDATASVFRFQPVFDDPIQPEPHDRTIVTYGNHKVQPLKDGDLGCALDVVDTLDPGAGAALRDAIDSGAIYVGRLFGGGHPEGVHDDGTIGLPGGKTCEALGVALLHEYRHILNCFPEEPEGSPQDEGDDRTGDPCYPCTHAAMAQQSADEFASLICFKEYEDVYDQEQDCNELEDLNELPGDILDEWEVDNPNSLTCYICADGVAASNQGVCPACDGL